MKRSIVFAAAMAALVAGAPNRATASTEQRTNKTFTVQPGGTLVVDVDFGSVEVSSHEGEQVVVDVYRKVSRATRSGEETFLANRPLELTCEDGAVTVRSRTRQRLNFNWGAGRTEAKYKILVPAKFNARLATAGGPIKVQDITGQLKGSTSGGDLEFTGIHGDVEGNTSGGSVKLQGCEGTQKIATSGGDIAVRQGAGSLRGHTSGGGIKVEDFKGPVAMDTSGGDIRLSSVVGAIQCSTTGGSINAVLRGSPVEATKLSTTGGGITVMLPENAAFNLDAATTGGGVHSELPVAMAGKIQNSRINGAVNGGGNSVVLRTTGGGIEVKKGRAEKET